METDRKRIRLLAIVEFTEYYANVDTRGTRGQSEYHSKQANGLFRPDCVT